MGWLWSDSVPPHQPPIVEDHDRSNTSRPVPATPNAVPGTNAQPEAKSRDELADQELQSFLREIQADIKPSNSKYNRVPRQPPPASSHPSGQDGDEPLSEQLLPKTMSCRVAFDEAFYCNSFGGRFNDLYRYGNLRSCSEHWNDFWFCMRTRGYSDKEKQAAIKEHYMRKETMKYAKTLGKESSEDVWKSREKKLEWGEAFNVPFPDFDGSDEEWNRQQAAWRKNNVDGGAS